MSVTETGKAMYITTRRNVLRAVLGNALPLIGLGFAVWPAPGSEDTELGVFMGPEKSWRDEGLRGSSSLKLFG